MDGHTIGATYKKAFNPAFRSKVLLRLIIVMLRGA